MDGITPSKLGAEMLAEAMDQSIATGRKSEWKVVYFDSQESDEGPAKNAIDGDPETYWHTNYSTTQEKYPHEIQIDTGSIREVGGFSYFPRQDGVNGRVAKYQFFLSLDGKEWGQPVSVGRFKSGGELSKVVFDKPVKGRFFRFRALSEQQGEIWASVAELDLLKFYPKRP
jgi:beta-galactosidase